MNNVEKSVLSTLAYYDALEMPLSEVEIWWFLNKVSDNQPPHSLNDVLLALNNLVDSKHIESRQGLWFFHGREGLIAKRYERNRRAIYFWRKGRRIVGWLKFVPYVRMVMGSGSFAIDNTKPRSDIDLFIITAPNRIWLCRTLVTALIHLAGERRHGQKRAAKICLNHFVVKTAMNNLPRSLYTAHLYARLVPILGAEEAAEFFRSNSWIKKYLLHYPDVFLKPVQRGANWNWGAKALQYFLELILNLTFARILERFFRSWQQRRIAEDARTEAAGGRVIATDEQLEFHPASPEKRILDHYNKLIHGLGDLNLKPAMDSGLRT